MVTYGDPSDAVLTHLHKRICALADPVSMAVREAKTFKSQADQLEEDVLMSGAMRRDVEVVGIFSRGVGGFKLKPELR